MLKIIKSKLELYINSLDQLVQIPILQVESQIPGPHTLLTALNHGDEVIGLEAGLNLINQASTNPNFKGKLTLLTALNFAGFEQVQRLFVAENLNLNSYFNLNRSYNHPNKNLTSLVTKKVYEYILDQKPDFAIDIHSYGQNSLIHLILDRPGDQLEKSMIETAYNTQIPFYLEYEAETLNEQMLDYSLSNQLCIKGISAYTIELGPKRGFSKSQGVTATKALCNVLNSFNHFDLKNLPIYDDLELPINFLYNRLSVENDSQFSGYYKPLVDLGETICENQDISAIINLCGDVVHIVKSTTKGYIVTFEDEAAVYPNRQFATMITRIKI